MKYTKCCVLLVVLILSSMGCMSLPLEMDVNIRRITSATNPCDSFAWSPDSQNLAFISNTLVTSWTSKISVIDIETQFTEIKFQTNNGNLRTLSWSPVGNALVFASDTGWDLPGGGWVRGGELWILDMNDSGTPQYFGQGYEASWGPTGDRLAILSRFTSETNESQDASNLIIFTPETQKSEIVFSDGDAYSVAEGLSWSPDGQNLTFAFGEQNSSHPSLITNIDIYVLELSTMQTQVITTGGRNYSPTWSSDGKMVAYIHEGESQDYIILSNLDGTCRQSILESDEIWQIAWSPDGKNLAMNIDRVIYLLDMSTVSIGTLENDCYRSR